MSESLSSEPMLSESSRQMALQWWRNVCRKTKELAVVELTTIAVTVCCWMSRWGSSDTPAMTSVMSCSQYGQLVHDALLHWQPVQLLHQSADMRSSWCLIYGSWILATLFCTRCSFWMVPDGVPYSTALQRECGGLLNCGVIIQDSLINAVLFTAVGNPILNIMTFSAPHRLWINARQCAATHSKCSS